MSEKNSDPTFQAHVVAASVGPDKKSAITQPLNLSGSGALNAAECNIIQRTQIALMQIPLHPGAQ
jgi:hypothetical protein